jgi:hypothetical protein
MSPRPHDEPGREREVFHADDYELEYFARKNGLTAKQAHDLIERHGPDREALERAAALPRRH